jgi:N-acetyl-anhydromuramyl-L-alanine amidase AmpD
MSLSPPSVGNLQRFLNQCQGAGLVVDEGWGPKTEAALRSYQVGQRLPVSGQLDEATERTARLAGFVPFVQAKNYTPVFPKTRSIDLLVIHDMEYPEIMSAASKVATWFAGDTAPRASAHYCVDSVNVIQCVRDMDVAWHAPGANRSGIGIEHAGYAKQTRDDWNDAYSKAELTLSARLLAKLAAQYKIPLVKLSAADLSAQTSGNPARGICGHKDLTDAFSKGVGHWDPGPGFPWEEYVAQVRSFTVDPTPSRVV